MSEPAKPRTGFGRMGFGAFTRLLRDRRGATSIEYAMVAVGISIAVAAVVFGVGTSLKVGFYDKMNAAVTN